MSVRGKTNVTFLALALILTTLGSINTVNADQLDSLSLQLAKAIQSDEQGRGYFTTEEGLVDLLTAALGTSKDDATRLARDILIDRKGARYYFYSSSTSGDFVESQKVLAGRLRSFKQQ